MKAANNNRMKAYMSKWFPEEIIKLPNTSYNSLASSLNYIYTKTQVKAV